MDYNVSFVSGDVVIVEGEVECQSTRHHSPGEATAVQAIETLADTGEAKDYEKAVKALNNYFILKVHSTKPKSPLPQHGTTGRRNCGSVHDTIAGGGQGL